MPTPEEQLRQAYLRPVNIGPDADWTDLVRMTPLQIEHWKDQVDAIHVRRISDNDLQIAAELKAAGWTPEPLHPFSDAMFQWRWRRPGPRGGTLFLSPTQALTALRKAKA